MSSSDDETDVKFAPIDWTALYPIYVYQADGER